MSRICARCGKNLDLVGTAHNCLPLSLVAVRLSRDEIQAKFPGVPQPKPEKKSKRKR